MIFAGGDFDTDFTQNSLPARYRPDSQHLPVTNGEVDEVLHTGVPPPGIGGVGFGSSPNLAMDHIICELCPTRIWHTRSRARSTAARVCPRIQLRNLP